MAVKFAAGEVLVSTTEDDYFISLSARIERVLMELHVLIAERAGLSWKASNT